MVVLTILFCFNVHFWLPCLMTVGYCMLYNKAIKVQSQTGTEYVSTSLLRQLLGSVLAPDHWKSRPFSWGFSKCLQAWCSLVEVQTPASSQMPTRSLGGEISFVEYWEYVGSPCWCLAHDTDFSGAGLSFCCFERPCGILCGVKVWKGTLFLVFSCLGSLIPCLHLWLMNSLMTASMIWVWQG